MEFTLLLFSFPQDGSFLSVNTAKGTHTATHLSRLLPVASSASVSSNDRKAQSQLWGVEQRQQSGWWWELQAEGGQNFLSGNGIVTDTEHLWSPRRKFIAVLKEIIPFRSQKAYYLDAYYVAVQPLSFTVSFLKMHCLCACLATKH